MATQYGLLSAEDAVSQGLGGAAGLIGSYTPSPYPSFVPSQTKAPSAQNYMNYTPNQPMAQITAPNYKLNSAAPTWQGYNAQAPQVNQNYKGLMGGDYEALQQALAQPGQIQAQNAYNTANRNLNDTMGGRGLYGSSIMSTQANEGLNREYMNALSTNAANAAAQRYGMQATDLQNQNQFGMQQGLANQQATLQNQGLMAQQSLAQNAFGQDTYAKQLAQEQAMNAYGLDATKLGMTQNQNVYQAGVTDAARQQDYNLAALQYQNQQTEAQRQWQNQQALEQFQYQLASGQYTQQQQEAMINQYLALAGRGAPLQTANQQLAQQQALADQQAQASLWGGLLGAGTTLGSAYLLS